MVTYEDSAREDHVLADLCFGTHHGVRPDGGAWRQVRGGGYVSSRVNYTPSRPAPTRQQLPAGLPIAAQAEYRAAPRRRRVEANNPDSVNLRADPLGMLQLDQSTDLDACVLRPANDLGRERTGTGNVEAWRHGSLSLEADPLSVSRGSGQLP
jgi:hypothetical protein